MDYQLGSKIGEGGCSEVYEWMGAQKIVKLAKANTGVGALQAELHHSRVAWQYGLPVPKPYELVNVNGRFGIVFERVYGQSLISLFIRSAVEQVKRQAPDQTADDLIHVKWTARLLHDIHGHSAANLPCQRESIKHDIRRAAYLPDIEKEEVISRLERLPLKQQLCHGDPNPGNIMLHEGSATIIDWNNATCGNPEADLAEYILMLRYAILPSHMPVEAGIVLNNVREPSIRLFMAEYERLSAISYSEVEPWLLPVAARKLAADGISDEEKALLVQEIRRRLGRSA